MQSSDAAYIPSSDAVLIDGYRRLPPAAGLTPEEFMILARIAEELEVREDGMSLADLVHECDLEKDAMLQAVEALAEGSEIPDAFSDPLVHVYQMDDGDLRFTLTDTAWALLRSTTH